MEVSVEIYAPYEVKTLFISLTLLQRAVPVGKQSAVSCVTDSSSMREVRSDCYAHYDDHR